MSILSRVLHQALRAFKGRRASQLEAAELARLTARFPALAAVSGAAAAGTQHLARAYEGYIGNVSAADWAVSLQTAGLLRGLCVLLEPRAVLDLGSGFSSFVLRDYARAAALPCTVHSVDEDARWLEKTKDFLASNGLSSDGTFTWPEFQARAAARYDLVLHDMGRLPLRLEALPRALALAAPGGIVALDDMQSADYSQAAGGHCVTAGFEICNIRALTLDSFGRYACLAFRPAAG